MKRVRSAKRLSANFHLLGCTLVFISGWRRFAFDIKLKRRAFVFRTPKCADWRFINARHLPQIEFLSPKFFDEIIRSLAFVTGSALKGTTFEYSLNHSRSYRSGISSHYGFVFESFTVQNFRSRIIKVFHKFDGSGSKIWVRLQQHSSIFSKHVRNLRPFPTNQ